MTLTQIADGVYAYVQEPGGWCVNNAGLLTCGTRSALIDTVATRSRRVDHDQVYPGSA